MKWSTRELRVLAAEPLMIDETVDLVDQLKDRHSDIIEAKPLTVQGIILYEEGTILLQLSVAIDLVLPSTRSLEAVDVSLNFPIKERLYTEHGASDIVDEEDVIPLDLTSETVDLNQILLDNVITHLPLQVYTEAEKEADAYPEGKNWQVLSEEGYAQESEEQEESVDPRMAKLKNLFSDQEDNDD
ncbi:YceD family protein [Aerococcus kribbianus]|uniref:YceD family protein n=1 Tax=Aerococcus kribbianus TaxID=2999064 RepID=A0A9X3FNH2_9LACT|nr:MULTISPECIES: YceD family protein [unclassified Aerococcus]MCZ0717720.1 YceD family protein [Aerococcus sp. YH-aer221]MCZ0726008.1 YceD family protein [Aerococcus sp. YH-aer222]